MKEIEFSLSQLWFDLLCVMLCFVFLLVEIYLYIKYSLDSLKERDRLKHLRAIEDEAMAKKLGEARAEQTALQT